jgi:hypothetical protein
MAKILRMILTKINKASIKTLVSWPIVIGLILFIGSLLISEGIFGKDMPDTYIGIIGTISAFIFSLSGFFQIYRRQGPGILGTIEKGTWPVLMGVIWVTFTWILGLFLLYQLFLELIRD